MTSAQASANADANASASASPITYPSQEYFPDTDTLALWLRPAVGMVVGLQYATPSIIFFKDEAGRLTEIMVDQLSSHIGADAEPDTCTLSRAIRLGLGLSQQAFANLLGISVANIRNWDQGRRAPDEAALRLLEVAAIRPDALSRDFLQMAA